MTTTEFSNELDVIYENINKNGAPGLDGYEKSVILTNAQDMYVKGLIAQDPSAEVLPELIVVKEATPPTQIGYNGGYVFEAPNEFLKLLNEKVRTAAGEEYNVIPITNEEYRVYKSKPYQYPPRRRAWKLGLGEPNSVEIITRPNVVADTYKVRYVKKPSPIIVEDIGPETIDGISTITECELNPGKHRDIVKLAATLAEQYYMDKYGQEGQK